MTQFIFEPQSIPQVLLIRRRLFHDDRGWFSESYKRPAFEEAGLDLDFVQDNVVSSKQSVLRGLHYQLPPAAQGKLVSVTRGAILDVVVDLRRSASTFGRWVAAELTAEGGEMLWVPPGFAHGYLVLSEDADVLYKVTAEYSPALDRGIRWDDPALGIPWPVVAPKLSEKDRALPTLSAAENPF
ncbi:MAG: dTDP-4-dehydrorhamnose 3,5-epimerase [Longimicrobiales bacterium]